MESIVFIRWRPRELFNGPRVAFSLTAAAAFALPTALYHARYGWVYLWEAYLYHFARTGAPRPPAGGRAAAERLAGAGPQTTATTSPCTSTSSTSRSGCAPPRCHTARRWP